MIVFMYHDISDEGDVYSIGLNNFREHLQLFCKYKDNIIITFDDGLSGIQSAVYTAVEMGFNVVVFVVAGKIGGSLSGRKVLTQGQIKEMYSMGVKVGSHGLSHNGLSSLKDLEEEARVSKVILEDIVGDDVIWFSFPNGIIASGAKMVLFSLGYRYMATSEPGIWNVDVGFVPRFVVRRTDSLLELGAIAKGNRLFCLRRVFERKAILGIKKMLGNRPYEFLKSRLSWGQK